jgi:hypothetical protein
MMAFKLTRMTRINTGKITRFDSKPPPGPSREHFFTSCHGPRRVPAAGARAGSESHSESLRPVAESEPESRSGRNRPTRPGNRTRSTESDWLLDLLTGLGLCARRRLSKCLQRRAWRPGRATCMQQSEPIRYASCC